MAIKPASPSLIFLQKMLSLFASKQISVPSDFRSRVSKIKESLESDTSGLINSLIDFMISSAIVDFSVESSNKKVHEVLNNWIQNVNSELRGKVPCGIHSLAKEYYRERWKNSSLIVLRTIWEEKDGFILPTKLWFVDGGDIKIKDSSETKIIGSERYELIITKDDSIVLPVSKQEMIFVQKPFESWGTDYPTPFLIKRGIWENSELLKLIISKGSNVIGKALEYLLLMKKGNVDLIKSQNEDFIYSKEDLKEISKDFQELLDQMRAGSKGIPTYTTNFDTEIEHLIPEFDKVLSSSLYSPVERRILAGIGFIEILEVISSSRKDAVINPRAFISEVYSGISDFKILLNDILMTIIEKNKSIHRKAMNADIISIRNSPVKQFYTDDAKDLIRSFYDRGLVSKRTAVELGIDCDFDAEVERRKREQAEGLDDEKYPYTCYPPVTQNQETIPNSSETVNDPIKTPKVKNDKKVLPDRQPGTPEAKNFNQN